MIFWALVSNLMVVACVLAANYLDRRAIEAGASGLRWRRHYGRLSWPTCRFSTLSRAALAQCCTCQGKESQLCWVMREEWGFRFFICTAGAIPVVVVFILLFKK